MWVSTKKLNRLRQRVLIENEKDEEMASSIEKFQTSEMVRRIYAGLKDHPKVKWKESYKMVVDIPLAEIAGKDI